VQRMRARAHKKPGYSCGGSGGVGSWVTQPGTGMCVRVRAPYLCAPTHIAQADIRVKSSIIPTATCGNICSNTHTL
jgi:hypothetical protein